jgi:4-hydroxy-tetrahydrodipicolinate reductase
MKILIVGYGRMGRLVEQLAVEQGLEIGGCIDIDRGDWDAPADVALDFSTAEAVKANFARYVSRRLPVVMGTTGLSHDIGALRAEAERAKLGVVAASNFSIGVNLFEALAGEAARLMDKHQEYGAWIHEVHHAAKRDAPSGTALVLRDVMAGAGFSRPIDISSNRAGFVPGTHTIGFDGPSDTIELTHSARDRRGFAAGALLAARWIQGRHGWYSMADVLRAP